MKKSKVRYDELSQRIDCVERMRRDFVANVSHELRTPLTVIHGYLETLLSESRNSPYAYIFKQMMQHSKRMENLVSNLLLLSKLESTEVPSFQLINVAKMLDVIAVDATEISSDRGHRISIEACKDTAILGDESELKSLFSNLIFNAVKYTKDRGFIKIRWFRHHDQAVFEVIDNGIGIEKKHINRITERFYRVDNARPIHMGGTGLGLAIAKHSIIRHRGVLEIESELSKGSCFRVKFPLSSTCHI